MEWYVGGVAGLLGALDGITTHFGLKGGQVEETNALWRLLYPRLPLAGFILLLAGGQFVLSMLVFRVLGDTGQWAHLAVSLIVPIWNVAVICLTRGRE